MEQEIYYVDTLASEYNADSIDYKRSLRCLVVLTITSLIPALVFVFTSSILASGIIFCATIVALSIFHLHFGLIVLYFLLPVETAIMLSPYFTISKAMAIVVLVSFLCHLSRTQFIFPPAVKVLFVFIAWALMSIVWAESPLYAALSLVSIILNVGLMLILLCTVYDLRSFNLIMATLFIGACAASALIFFGKVSYSGESEKMGRVILSEGTNASVLGGNICMGFLAAFYLLLQKGFFKKIVIIAAMPVLLFAILKTQSRTPLGTAVIAPVFAFILAARGRQRIIYFLMAMLFLVVCAVGLYVAFKNNILPEKAMERFRNTYYDLRESGRIEVWQQGLRFILQRPINGWGWNNFQVLMGFRPSLSAAHNNVIAITAELGIVGLVLAAIMHFFLFKSVFKVNSLPLRWLGLALLLYTLITGASMTTYMQKDFWYALAFVMLLANIDRWEHKESLHETEHWDYQRLPEAMPL